MLTAEEARALMPQNKTMLSDVLNLIKQTAETDFNWVDSKSLSPNDKIELSRLGYKVRYTPADRDGPACYRIFW